MEEFLTAAEVCEKLKIHYTTIVRWRKQGLPTHGKPRCYRFKLSEVEQWLKNK